MFCKYYRAEILLKIAIITFNVFLKYFIGVSSARREKEIKRLNQVYLDAVAVHKGLKETLQFMIDSESYRWICRATYSLSPEPLRPCTERNSEENVVQDSVKKNRHFYIIISVIIKGVFIFMIICIARSNGITNAAVG